MQTVRSLDSMDNARSDAEISDWIDLISRAENAPIVDDPKVSEQKVLVEVAEIIGARSEGLPRRVVLVRDTNDKIWYLDQVAGLNSVDNVRPGMKFQIKLIKSVAVVEFKFEVKLVAL